MPGPQPRGVGPVGRPPNLTRSTFLSVSEFFYIVTRLILDLTGPTSNVGEEKEGEEKEGQEKEGEEKEGK